MGHPLPVPGPAARMSLPARGWGRCQGWKEQVWEDLRAEGLSGSQCEGAEPALTAGSLGPRPGRLPVPGAVHRGPGPSQGQTRPQTRTHRCECQGSTPDP